ncbi:MAG: hypothetical protein CMF46_02270 [Legionellales bacterium]|nr:hypothetical protein [Legionellales bacterium]
MKIYFLGVRGSVPVSGSSKQTYGGATSCIYLELSDRVGFIIDAGTGIMNLKDLVDTNVFLLLTHQHWDHIQGFPHFSGIYDKDKKIRIYSKGYRDTWPILSQMDGIAWPIHYQSLASEITTHDLSDFQEDFVSTHQCHGLVVKSVKLNHPGGAYGFKISYQGNTAAFIFDHEIDHTQLNEKKDEWLDLLDDCDIVVHDLQYQRKRDHACVGWGHPFIDDMCQFFSGYQGSELVVFGHHPIADDAELDFNQAQLQQSVHPDCHVSVAKDKTYYDVNRKIWGDV